MRIFLPIVLLIVLTACGTSKIRYVRAKTEKQKIVHIENEREIQDEIAHRKIEVQHSAPVATPVLDEVVSDHGIEEPSIEFEKNVATQDEEPSSEQKDKIYAALDAERSAKKAKGMLISSASTFLVSIVFPLGLIAALVLFIIGIVHFGRANNSRYITLRGEQHLTTARVFLVISNILLVLYLILLGLVIAIIFL